MKACTAEQMRAIDARAGSEFGMPSLLLMENAGRAVAERALAMVAGIADPRIHVACGKGNNGGDGFVAARHLANRGARVECTLAGDPAEVRGDARVNLELLEKLGIAARPPAEVHQAHLVIDALLGTGFQGAPRGAVADAIRLVNRSRAPVLAVDIPSALNADTGAGADPCVHATETVTFGLPKVGMLTGDGLECCGEITVANISLPRQLLEEACLNIEWLSAERVRPLWPERPRAAHKGDSGRLFVLAGSVGMTGAATLVCGAALRAGAGLVTLGAPESLNDLLEVKLTEAMTLPLPETETRALSPEGLKEIRSRLERSGALAAGPGFGRHPRTGELLRAVLADCPVPVVLDADGLTLLSPADARTFPARCVLTPHPGEMARLLGTETAELQSKRLEVTKMAAAKFGCAVLLKGAGTVIAAPDGRAAVNSSGSAALATGGTGDALTGIIGACLARGLEPFEAAVAGVFIHGIAGEVAGERFGAPGAIAGDVVAAIPEALRRLREGEIPSPCRTM